jgi:hypothetical protein
MMKNAAYLIVALSILTGGAGVAAAAPVMTAGMSAIASGDGLVVKTAYHSHKNMKKVHKAQGGGGK